MDNDGKFEDQATKVAEKIRKRNRVLMCMAGAAWGAAEANLKMVYNGFVVAPAVYALGVWYPWLSQRKKEELQVVANVGARVIKRQPITCRLEVLRHQAQVSTIEQIAVRSRMALAERYWQRTGREVGRVGGKWGRADVRDRLGIRQEIQIERPLARKQVVAAYLALGTVRERIEVTGGEWREDEIRK